MDRKVVGEEMRCKTCNRYVPDRCICGKPRKGEKGGTCNVTACQQPNARYFNKSTKAYYCETCTEAINWPGGRAETMRLFGTLLLCEPDNDELYVLASDYQQALFFANEKQVSRDNLRYIKDAYDLRGIDGRGQALYCFGAAWRQKSYREILDAANIRGFEIKYV